VGRQDPSIPFHRSRGSSQFVTTQSPSEGGKDSKHQRYSIFHAGSALMSPERRGMPLTERATAAAFTGPALADDGSADAHPWSGGGRGCGNVRMVGDRAVVGSYPGIDD
jgi:hypothetical protein